MKHAIGYVIGFGIFFVGMYLFNGDVGRAGAFSISVGVLGGYLSIMAVLAAEEKQNRG